MFSFRSQWGYQWNESVDKQHRFNPFIVNFFVTGKLSDAFKMSSYEGLLLAAGFMDRFLLGGDYSYTYNSQLKGDNPLNWYFAGSIDLSGNATNAFFNLIGKKENSESGQYEIFGVPYSQYARFEFDLRNYWQVKNRSKFVFRFFPGLGLAYGNSSQIPYMKRFYTGGPNSIRAFAPRMLGPGTYQAPDSLGVLAKVAHSGDIKLEANVEYRYDLTRFLKFAWFMDAGNVWLRKENPDYTGGHFMFSSFWHQIAIGTGLGLRIDAGFFIFRFDLAFPLVKPHEEKFILLKPHPLNSSWRRENLMLNVAIGYPF
jgi:outer membrane protein insertion porin family